MTRSDSMFRFFSLRRSFLRQAALYLAMAAGLGLFAGRAAIAR
jgi:hypothetical protein